MHHTRSSARPFIALLAVIAVVAAACGTTTHVQRPGRLAGRAERRSLAGRRPVARRRHARAARRRTRPERRPGRPLVHRHRQRRQARADRRRAEVRGRLQRGPEGCLPVGGDLRQLRRREHAPAADRVRQSPGHHRAGRRRGPQHLHRQPARPRAAHRVREVRHDQVQPGAGRLLQDGRRGRDDRRPVRHLSVVHLLQQEAVRRGEAALSADQGRRAVRRQAVGHGSRPAAGHEAHRRQERQRRHEPRLRREQHRPVGL